MNYIEKHRARKASILAAHSADTDAEAWHTRRLLGIGGSEVAAVLNLDALGHKTPLDIWRKKTAWMLPTFQTVSRSGVINSRRLSPIILPK